MKKTLMTFAASAAALAFATSANASTFVIDSVSSQYGSPSGQISTGTQWWNETTYNASLSPQKISGTWDGQAADFIAYCLEITQFSGTGTFNVVSLTDYLGNTLAGDVAALVSNYAGGDKNQSAALQLALWETRYEKSYNSKDLDSGYFELEWASQNKTTLINTANSYLANKGAIDGDLEFWVATNSKKQDLLFYTVKPPVPEPATWAMMIIGFATIGRAMRARRTNTAVSFS
jgi:PEP-CTERM motif.